MEGHHESKSLGGSLLCVMNKPVTKYIEFLNCLLTNPPTYADKSYEIVFGGVGGGLHSSPLPLQIEARGPLPWEKWKINT